MSCCNTGLADVFTEDVSRKDADRYRRKGLPSRARKLLKALGSPDDRTTLEIGVGAGALTVEMLRRGAKHSVGVDAIPGQLAVARQLAAEFGVADRADFILGDFTESSVENADIVVMDRVVCCYPDWRGLLASASARADRTIALTYPRDIRFTRAVSFIMNLFWRLRRSEFRFRVHPVDEMHAFLRQNGLTPGKPSTYLIWDILVATRNGVG